MENSIMYLVIIWLKYVYLYVHMSGFEHMSFPSSDQSIADSFPFPIFPHHILLHVNSSIR